MTNVSQVYLYIGGAVHHQLGNRAPTMLLHSLTNVTLTSMHTPVQ